MPTLTKSTWKVKIKLVSKKKSTWNTIIDALRNVYEKFENGHYNSNNW